MSKPKESPGASVQRFSGNELTVTLKLPVSLDLDEFGGHVDLDGDGTLYVMLAVDVAVRKDMPPVAGRDLTWFEEKWWVGREM